MNYFFWILQVNEDNEPNCSKQQDEGEHTCQPHNYCPQINPVLTQEKNCIRSPGHSSLIVFVLSSGSLVEYVYKK